MTTVLALVAGLVALVAAVRSTWSPCGLSMLATITPLAEQGRGHRYRTTAGWFITGSVVGGATLGAVMALLAAGVAALHASNAVLAAIAAAASAATLAADAGVGGFRLPIHHRQVNERWLDQFRPWVYGAGFGWQIGNGVATYVKTCGVYLIIVLAALTGSPTTALVVGVVFGLVRGLAVFLGRQITSTIALADFHRRFTAADPVALAAVVATEAAAALTFSALVAPWLGAALAAILGLTLATWVVRRRQRQRQTPRVAAPAVHAGDVTIP
jgi:MFS family permease